MRAFTRWVLHHKLWVVVAWVIIAVVAFASTSSSAGALSSEFNLPGRESSEAAAIIYQQYGNGGPRVNGPIVPVVELPEGTTMSSPGVREKVGAAFAKVADAIPGSRAADYASTGDPLFVSKDGRTTFGVVWYPASDVAFDRGRARAEEGARGGGRPHRGRRAGADHRDRRPQQRRRPGSRRARACWSRRSSEGWAPSSSWRSSSAR